MGNVIVSELYSAAFQKAVRLLETAYNLRVMRAQSCGTSHKGLV